MRVLMVTAGATGDVLPYTGLAARLAEAGHRPVIATHGDFAPLVRERGLEFRSFGDEEAGHEEHTFGRGSRELVPNARRTADLVRNLDHGIEAMRAVMAEGADVVLLSTTSTPLGWHAAEAAGGLPTVGVFLQPAHPTREWPPAFLSGRRSLGGWGNAAAAGAAHAAIDRATAGAAKRFRARHGLPPVPARAFRRRVEERHWPVCYGFSPTVVPRPADWRPGLEVVGYWWPRRPTGWEPPPGLQEFLEAGPPPVLIGFGSTAIDAGHRGRVAEALRGALRLAGVRGVVQSGWAGLSVADDHVFPVGAVPHDWLMPRVAAVVHHGGAGTTAAALRAGVPAVTVPAGMDRPFWAERQVALGTSPGWVPIARLGAERLAELIRRAVSGKGHRERAREVAEALAAEDGAARVLETALRAAAPAG
ncbi:glycosyltransferase [Streptomyces sp. DSM 44917]|uniref:Glycosyltransferase n=1 Tax=Streptomyces boetiae TaxID=3075541 RepID=A0ABU2LDI9_9ACTN|nr:glycosyltransferase [Streptomyces sp. DSM 44917]MDT0309551.1 glycosyltransferase [Streptomyces sp. DSM 44917]